MVAVRLSDSTLRRKLWLDAASLALCDYRDPGYVPSAQERAGLAIYLDRGFSPVDAAEAYQAATG